MSGFFESGAARRCVLALLFAGGASILGSGAASADDLLNGPVPNYNPLLVPTVSLSDYFANWENRVKYAQSTQPHWMTPLVTVTPRLEQEIRYDQYFETQRARFGHHHLRQRQGPRTHSYDDERSADQCTGL